MRPSSLVFPVTLCMLAALGCGSSARSGSDLGGPFGGSGEGQDGGAGGGQSGGTSSGTGGFGRADAGGSIAVDASSTGGASTGASGASMGASGTSTGSSGSSGSNGASGASGGSTGAWWKPKAGATWQWDLSGAVSDLKVAVDVYDIDGFDNTADTIKQLHEQGKKVICYISVGTLEPGRPDAAQFPAEAKGKYWAEWGEYYLDIRAASVREIMKKRLDMCRDKGFDAVEPDNMDMFEGGMSETGFPLSEADGVDYAKWLAQEAHARGLGIGQKNASSITSAIEGSYDWALTEDCFDGGWCDDMKPYASDDKPVFMCEYTDTKVNFSNACSAAKQSRYSAILKHRQLDNWVQFCP